MIAGKKLYVNHTNAIRLGLPLETRSGPFLRLTCLRTEDQAFCPSKGSIGADASLRPNV